MTTATIAGEQVNVYDNVMYMSFDNIDKSTDGLLQQDTFFGINETDRKKLAACIACIIVRHKEVREVLHMAVEMSYKLERTQN